MSALRLPGFSLLALLCCAGCDIAAITIKGTVDGTKEFTDAHGKEFADPELVGPVLAANIVTAEGLLYYVPEYEPLLQGTIFSNIAYGIAWLGAKAHENELAGKFDEAELLNRRAGLLYARALALAKRMLRLRDDGFDEAMAGGLPMFKVWIDEHFYKKEDASVLLSAGTAYFVSMIESDEGLAAAVDVPYARYMVERSIELDDTIEAGQGLAIIGVLECTIPAMVGGNPKLGLLLLQRAAKVSERQSHGVLVQTAERCAVALQDRKMFHDLLMEVIESGDIPQYRLPNKLARHQAERLLKQIDEFFYE